MMNKHLMKGAYASLLLLMPCYAQEAVISRFSPQGILQFLQDTIEPGLQTLADRVEDDAAHITRIDASGIQEGPTVITSATTITTAGDYILGADITITLNDAITISASDVNLDLNGRTITGSASATNGIVISTGVSRVTIADGTIRGMSNAGIYVQGNKCVVSDCQCISNRIGIQVLNGNDTLIRNCQSLDSIEHGFCLEGSVYGMVSNCCAQQTGGVNQNAFGFIAAEGTGNIFIDCIVDGVTTTSTSAAGQVAGFRLNNEIYSEIINCRATAISATAGSAVPFGINLETGHSLVSVATFNNTANSQINSVDWLVDKDGSRYLAYGANGGSPDVRVLKFTPGATSPLVDLTPTAATFSYGAAVQVVRWLMDPNGDKYLLVGGNTSGGIQIRILKFDPSSGTPLANLTPTAATFAYGNNILGAEWLVDPDGTRYVAVGGTNAPATALVLAFDPTAITPLATLTPTAATFSFSPDDVRTFSWFVDTNGTRYLAVGIRFQNSARPTVRLLLFNPAAGTPLTNVAGAVFQTGALVRQVQWLVDTDGTPYLATGGNGSSSGSGPEVKILKFIPSSTTYVDTASYQYSTGVTGVMSVNWLKAGLHKYLAVGGLPPVFSGVSTTDTVHVLDFDSTVPTLMDFVGPVVFNHTSMVDSIAWLWDGDPFLAVGSVTSDGTNIDITKLNLSAIDCIVQEDLVRSVSGGAGGIGYFGDTQAGRNLFIDNIAFAAGTSYSFTDTLVNNVNNRAGT